MLRVINKEIWTRNKNRNIHSIMKYIEEYREPATIAMLTERIHRETTGEYRFMEVCGSHTHAIRKHGIPSLLPAALKLLSGPGCPVCVTPRSYIDTLVNISKEPDTIIASYGDLIRIPGTEKSLQNCREEGRDIRIVYSSLDALSIAEYERGKNVIFAAIGFETTAPSTAVAIKKAKEKNLENFRVLSSHKLMPPVMKAVIDGGTRLDGYICPGHVSTITGSRIYDIFPRKFKVATVISGFEPVDILLSVLMLIRQVNSRKFKTEIQYSRAVRPEGNPVALNIMNEVFNRREATWRGLGNLELSGLGIREAYKEFDASYYYKSAFSEGEEPKGCICGEILRGLKDPPDCKLYGKTCTPRNPAGACMVSSEGACNAWFQWNTPVFRNY